MMRSREFVSVPWLHLPRWRGQGDDGWAAGPARAVAKVGVTRLVASRGWRLVSPGSVPLRARWSPLAALLVGVCLLVSTFAGAVAAAPARVSRAVAVTPLAPICPTILQTW